MSFSSEIKKEIARIRPDKKCCAIAEFTALLSYLGSISVRPGEEQIRILTENVAVAQKCLRMLRGLFSLETELDIRKNAAGGRNHQYEVLIRETDAIRGILDMTQISQPEVFQERIQKKSCCVRAFLRGSFLAAGSVSDPGKSYHCEFLCRGRAEAEYLKKLMEVFEIVPGITTRKGRYVVYLKDSSRIIDLLNVIGAHQSLMQMENIRILKEMRNSANRQFNCDAANISKMVRAAGKQVEDIQRIRESDRWERLSPALKETALARLENPDISIQELGTMLDPPLGKSGVNHRLRKLSQIAQELRLHRD